MKNNGCKALYRYWDQLRGDQIAPARTAIEPSEISEHLRDTFILEADTGTYSFRLAGTRLCAAFGKELKGASFLDLWRQDDRIQILSTLGAVADEGRAAALGILAYVSRQRSIAFELLLLPLVQSGPRFDRTLGVMVPIQLPFWLGLEPLVGQEITSARLIWPDKDRLPDAHLAAPDEVTMAPTHLGAEQRRKRLVVLDGGKSGR